LPSFHVIRAAMLTVASATAWLAAPPGAAGLNTVINNGLAPPDNVINYALHGGLHVQNVGCNADVVYPCAAPGAPTTVALIEGWSAEDLAVYESSTVTISGHVNGVNALTITALDSSTVTMSGSGTFYILALDSSTVTMSRGSVFALDGGGAIEARGSSTVTISGGYLDTFLRASDSAHLTLVGTGFAVDGTPVGYGPLAASGGVLTGWLQFGQYINQYFTRSGGAIISVSAPLPPAVPIDWVPIGNAGNAPDTPSTNCYAADCGSVAYDFWISKYEVTNAQYAEFLNMADPGGSNALALYNTNMNTDASNGGISFVPGNASGSKYVVKSGLATKPVNYVSFYDSLRFSNWLNNGQGIASTETGAYTLLGGTPTPSNALTIARNFFATVFLPSENKWYKAAYYDPSSGTYFDYPTWSDAPTVCSAPTAAPIRANCSQPGVTAVGAYTGSASPTGRSTRAETCWNGTSTRAAPACSGGCEEGTGARTPAPSTRRTRGPATRRSS